MDAYLLALQRDKYPNLTDDDFRWMVQQVAGKQRALKKLPEWALKDDWWWSKHLNLEQCSSEITARHKADWLSELPLGTNARLVDLTAGFGVDAYYMSRLFTQTDIVEQDAELCRIDTHNFALCSFPVTVHNTTAENYLNTLQHVDVLYLDPARRDKNGSKVFRITDCTPDILQLLRELKQKADHILLKLSPMLDITDALRTLGNHWDTQVVAVDNEVKEVLMHYPGKGIITAVDLYANRPQQQFSFRREDEYSAILPVASASMVYLYEPSAALMKAAPYKLLAARYGIQPLDNNSHLYLSDTLLDTWQGRVWHILSSDIHSTHDLIDPVTGETLRQVHIITRNYPLKTTDLSRKLRIREGGHLFVIGTRYHGKPILLLAEQAIKTTIDWSSGIEVDR